MFCVNTMLHHALFRAEGTMQETALSELQLIHVAFAIPAAPPACFYMQIPAYQLP